MYSNYYYKGYTSVTDINCENIMAVFWSFISDLYITLLKLFFQAVCRLRQSLSQSFTCRL